MATPLIVEDRLQFDGIATKGGVVLNGGRLLLRGEVIGDLTIKSGGQAVIHGTVNGIVINDGGLVDIFGTIDGLISPPGAMTFVDAGATVGT